MCTVTLIPSAQGLRLTMNRDEAWQRSEAGLHHDQEKNTHYCYPLDSLAGGTWIGANNHGVAMALLNRYQVPLLDKVQSRGNIIANAIGCGNLQNILQHLQQLDLAEFNAFDCLISNQHESYQLSWNTQQMSLSKYNIGDGIMFTSSSEHLNEVRHYRQEQFNHWKKHHGHSSKIDTFHLSQAPDMPRSSVFMCREYSHTKSLVQIDISDEQCHLNYFPADSLKANTRLRDLPRPAQWTISCLTTPSRL